MYPTNPQRSPTTSDSRFDTNSKRTAVDMMARDKLFQWTECRVWINSAIVADIMDTHKSADKSHPPAPAPERNAVTTFLRDPKKEKTGGLLKQKYCESMIGLQGSSYFVFGLPRVRGIVKDLTEDLGLNSEKNPDRRETPEKTDYLSETQKDTSRGSPDDIKLGESRYDYKLGESRSDNILGESRNDYKFGESRSDNKLGENRYDYKLGESRNDYKLGESRSDNKFGKSRNDYKLGESRNDYKFEDIGNDRLGDTRNNRLKESQKRMGESRNDRLGETLDDRRSLRDSSRQDRENEPPDSFRSSSRRQDDFKPNPLGQSGAYDFSSSYRQDLRESRRPRPEPREPEEPNLYSSRVMPDRRADDRGMYSSRVLPDPPSYGPRVLPERPSDPRDRYDDIQSWMPDSQLPKAPRSRDDYPLPPPPPPPHRQASGRYTGVIRK
ncbi:nipped-B-like protein [Saccostrea echinata]|uniref:nipped-B-like protein n=1 Tax=Saccostrea echinata TaxID=191078 RepID=UPI002A7FB707|nr:nipped-B-like protein [Saccostrea echinata]